MPGIFWIVLGVFSLAVIAFLILPRPKGRGELGDTGDLDKRPTGKHPALGAGYREGPTLRYGDGAYGSGDLYSEFARDARLAPHRRAGPPTPRGAPFGKRVTLTPRHLEHINILRRRDDRPPLNAAGFRTAIARQATAAEPRAINSTDDWVAYLIGYAILSSDHEQSRVACEHTITISPDAPFNGQPLTTFPRKA